MILNRWNLTQKYSYYTGYVTIKEYLKVYSVNSLHLTFRSINEYFEEINKSKYLILVSTNESTKKKKNLWITVK